MRLSSPALTKMGLPADGRTEMNGKHTPGPWAIEHKVDGGFTYAPRIHVGPARIHYSAGYHAEFKARAEADARLIAAAPDLLDVAARLVRLSDSQYHGDDAAGQFDALVAQARTAINRATGGES